ncbi:hypothetical protein GCM10010524_20950 [Streptomyces mexicanus]
MHGVREVDDVDADPRETPLQLVPLGRPAPVVALEDDVEADPLPCLQLVLVRLDDGQVDAAQALDDLQALGERDDRRPALETLDQVVGGDSGDEAVAVPAGLAQNVEVPDVEQVVDAGCESDAGHFAAPPDVPAFAFPGTVTRNGGDFGEVFRPSVTSIRYS